MLLCLINYVDVCTETYDSRTQIIAVVFYLSQTRRLLPTILTEKESPNRIKIKLLIYEITRFYISVHFSITP